MPLINLDDFEVPLNAGIPENIFRRDRYDPHNDFVSALPELDALESDFTLLQNYAESQFAQGVLQNISVIATRNSGALGQYFGVVKERIDGLRSLLSIDSLYGLYEEARGLAGELWDEIRDLLEPMLSAIADAAANVLSVVPYVGWAVKICTSMYRAIRAIDRWMGGPKKPQVACGGWIYFNNATDVDLANSLMFGATIPGPSVESSLLMDWTDIFSPRTLVMKYTRLREEETEVQHEGWRLEPASVPVEEDRFDPANCFHLPNGLGQRLGWQSMSKFGLESSEISEAFPSMESVANDLWARSTQNGIDAFRIDLDNVDTLWGQYFSLAATPTRLQDAQAASGETGLDITCHDPQLNSLANFYLTREQHPIVMWEDGKGGKIKIAAFANATQLWSAWTPKDKEIGGQLAAGNVLEQFKQYVIQRIESLPSGSAPFAPHRGFTTLDPFDQDLLQRFGKQSALSGNGWLHYPGRPFRGGRPATQGNKPPVIPEGSRITYVSLGLWVEFIMRWFKSNTASFINTQTAAYLSSGLGYFRNDHNGSKWQSVIEARKKMLQQPATCMALELDMIRDPDYRDAVQQMKIKIGKGFLQGTSGGITAPPDSLPPDLPPAEPAPPSGRISGVYVGDPSETRPIARRGKSGGGGAIAAMAAAAAILWWSSQKR